MSHTYRETQAQLKDLRSQGHKLECALNAKHSVLTAELNRLTSAEAPTPSAKVAKKNPKRTSIQDELATAKARIAELEAEVSDLIAEKQMMLKHMNATQAPVAKQAEVSVLETITSTAYEDNYTPMYIAYEHLKQNITLEQFHRELYKLQAENLIELSSLQEGNMYTAEQHDCGIPQNVGGCLFFISLVK